MNLSAFADLLASRGLRLLPGSYAVPVELLVELPEATIAHFTARGTTIRLRLYSPESLTAIVITAQCGCGDHHPQVGPDRLVLGHHAIPTAEYTLDGELLFGWQNHEAGLLRLVDASAYFFNLLGQVPFVASPAAEAERTPGRRRLISAGYWWSSPSARPSGPNGRKSGARPTTSSTRSWRTRPTFPSLSTRRTRTA
jgi:hypothetical protein